MMQRNNIYGNKTGGHPPFYFIKIISGRLSCEPKGLQKLRNNKTFIRSNHMKSAVSHCQLRTIPNKTQPGRGTGGGFSLLWPEHG
jgi:hypothetical protein